jgi:integral membrane sensor domain MASE1
MRWPLGGADAGPVQALAVAAGYVATGKLALLGGLLYHGLAPLYPPTGIALACLLLLGLRIWPGLVIGATALYLTSGASPFAAVTLSFGTTLAPVCAYLFLRRLRFRVELDRLRDAVSLVLVGGSAMVLSGFVGVLASVLEGETALDAFAAMWFLWWTGDAMGVLVFTPLLLTLARVRVRAQEAPPTRWVEALALVVSTLVVSVLAVTSPYNLLFLVFPFLAWAAVRFQQVGVSPSVMVVASVALVAAMREIGPFEPKGPLTNLVTLQVFNASAALTGLIIAALMCERNAAYQRIENASTQLAAAVSHLSIRLGAEEHVERWTSERRP